MLEERNRQLEDEVSQLKKRLEEEKVENNAERNKLKNENMQQKKELQICQTGKDNTQYNSTNLDVPHVENKRKPNQGILAFYM